MNPVTVLRLLETQEFQVGAIAGLIALAVALALRDKAPHFGLLFSFAAVAAIGWLGLFAWPLTERALTREWWIIPLGIVTVVFATYGLSGKHGEGPPVLMAGISVGGMWATVPDTEIAAAVVGVAAGLAILAALPHRTAMAFVGAEFFALIAVWAVAVGAVGRNGAVVGGFGAVASLALIRWRRVSQPWWDLGLHVVLVLLWARVAGLRQSALEAVLLGASGTVVVAAVRWQSARRFRQLRQTRVTVVEHRPEADGADGNGDERDDDRRLTERNEQNR